MFGDRRGTDLLAAYPGAAGYQIQIFDVILTLADPPISPSSPL